MSPLLEVSSLTAAYGKVVAVRGVSLTVDEGTIVSVIGPNGAGKTTVLNALMGLHPSRGPVTFRGKKLEYMSAEARLEAGLCLIAERRELFGSMNVEDNLRLGAFVQRRNGRAAIEQGLEEIFTRFPHLKERRGQLARTLSGGERQMLAIGRALMSRPKLLMMDEPSLGLAPLIVERMFEIISDLKKAGVSILLVEQNARGALAVSDRAYVIEVGEVVIEGTSNSLERDPRVIESYLGMRTRSEEHEEDTRVN